MTLNRQQIFKITFIVAALCSIFLLVFAYLHYLDLKKILLSRLSDKATSLIGQKVDIGDLSFGPSGGIVFYDLSIKNPEYFDSGQLLTIEKLSITMKFSGLLKGRFYFKKIGVHSPKLTVIKDMYGRLNISDKLKLFLSKKPAFTYQVDEFTIESGLFDLNKDERYRSEGINVTLRNLSSDPGTRTLINGSLFYAKTNKVKIEGWVYLKDEPRKFGVSFSSDDIDLSPFKEYFSKYKISTQRSKITMNAHAEGDTERGVHLKSKVQVIKMGFFFLKRGVKKIILNMDAFLSIQDGTVAIKDISVFSGNVAILRLKGIITDIKENPSYKGELTLDRIDLSVFNFMRGLDVRGLLTSDTLRIRGTFRKTMPELSGTVQLREGAVTSNDIDVKTVNARVVFLEDKSIEAKATAEVFRAGEYTFDKPADIRLSLNTHGKYEKVAFLSSVSIPPCSIYRGKAKTAYVNGSTVTVSGIVEDRTFIGESSFEIHGIQYADHTIPRLKGRAGIDYRKNLIKLKDFDVSTEDLYLLVSQMHIKSAKNIQGYTLGIRGMDASYPKKKADIRDVDLSVNLRTGNEYLSGVFNFSARHLMVGDISAGLVLGSGGFNKKDFSVDIPRADVSGGRIKLALEGKTSGGPFPLKINLTANNIDLGFISRTVPKISDIPYRLSGNIEKGAFNGIMNSMDSLSGNAEVEARKISVFKRDSKRNILRNVSVDSKIQFAGDDLEFKADAIAGNISTRISGEMKKFKKEDRSMNIRAGLPEVKVTDIRDAFWDIFPDSLLYAGFYGYISSDVLIDYSKSGLKLNGNVTMRDFILEGENNEYSAGPVNGVIPIAYAKPENGQKPVTIPSFERSEFDTLSAYYLKATFEKGFSRITIGSFRYGFRLLKDIVVWVKPEGTVLNFERFSGTIFGGRVYGSAVVDMSNGFRYRAGVLLKGLSLKTLCEEIEPIKGYISGNIDGVAQFKGFGTGISQIIGKADFWTYSTDNEKTKISREFLRKIGGPSLKTYIGERRFDKGIMSLYVQNGFLIFKELEISNRNFFGLRDLSIKVMPFNNRIAIDHLMWTITEAAQRAKEKS